MSYAFTFDARSCSGCKACQEACKDKNQLPVGILWRRVIEVSGGEWHPAGKAWENSVFAYYLSIACNHCTHPKCAGVCPTDAFLVRQDGIVLIDLSRCMGCGYCAWACPYGVPQYDATRGVMTKCDFCYDSLEAGLPPSCVAACPLRVLDYETLATLDTTPQGLNLWQLPGKQHPFPLPGYSRTEPHLAIKPHAGMNNTLPGRVSNREELLPPGSLEAHQGPKAIHELPLAAFTLLIQMAVGMAVSSLVLPSIAVPVLLSIGILIAAGGLVSFLHLGRKRNAWRSVVHLRKSWLSREVLLAGLFGLSWVGSTIAHSWGSKLPSLWLMSILGILLVYSMSRVYQLRAVPSWNSWRTTASFFLSAAVLGALAINIPVPHRGWLIAAALAMTGEVILAIADQHNRNHIRNLRIVLLGLGILAALLGVLLHPAFTPWMAIAIFLVALSAEAIGRWQFYTQRESFPFVSE